MAVYCKDCDYYRKQHRFWLSDKCLVDDKKHVVIDRCNPMQGQHKVKVNIGTIYDCCEKNKDYSCIDYSPTFWKRLVDWFKQWNHIK